MTCRCGGVSINPPKQRECRECHRRRGREYHKRMRTQGKRPWHTRTPEGRKWTNAYRRRLRAEFRDYVALVKSLFHCDGCGAKRGNDLDFHHEDPFTKRNDVAAMDGYSLESVWEEIGKCVLLVPILPHST